MSMNETILPKEPEKGPCLLVSGTLGNGRDFDFAVREDRGDRLTESPEALVFVNGTTGQEITIARPQIALLSKVTVQVSKDPLKVEQLPRSM
jgi:hypothetical protein